MQPEIGQASLLSIRPASAQTAEGSPARRPFLTPPPGKMSPIAGRTGWRLARGGLVRGRRLARRGPVRGQRLKCLHGREQGI